MSIVSLDKVTFIGMAEDRSRLLEDRQNLGCLHIWALVVEGWPNAWRRFRCGARLCSFCTIVHAQTPGVRQ